jgi:hypothetical protein
MNSGIGLASTLSCGLGCGLAAGGGDGMPSTIVAMSFVRQVTVNDQSIEKCLQNA